MLRAVGLALLVLPTMIYAADDPSVAVARWRAREKVLAGADLSWTVEGKGRLLQNLAADFEVRRGSDGKVEHRPVKGEPFAYRYRSRLDITRHPGYDRVAYEDAGMNLIERRIDPIEHATLFGPWLIARGSATDRLNPDHRTHPRGIVELQAVAVTADTPMAAMLRHDPLTGAMVSFPTEAAPFLAGPVPLDLRGLRPESIRRVPQGWAVRYQFAGERILPGTAQRAPYAAEVTLADDGLPLRIVSRLYDKPLLILATQGVRTWRGVRVPARVLLQAPAYPGRIAQNDVLWTLRTIAPTQRLDERRRGLLDPRPQATVVDWRLLGRDLDAMEFPPRGTPKRYAWKGRFPSLKELRGEADMVWSGDSTAPAPSPTWPPYAMGAGLVGLIGGGAWLLARRKRR